MQGPTFTSVQGWTTSAHRADEYSMTQKGIILAES
jgi:hypothetical protein